MRIHGEPDNQQFPVNGTLYINTSDIPASRKITGLRGVTSEDFMCTSCYQTFSSLVCEDCFNRESEFSSFYCISFTLFPLISEFSMRDERRFRKYAYRWRDASTEEREKIETERGVSWSTLTSLPGWMPARDSPIDFMHAVFLGKHIITVLCSLIILA